MPGGAARAHPVRDHHRFDRQLHHTGPGPGNRAVERLRTAIVEAEEANRAKTLFLANVSHEIRTPMNGVLGMLTLLQRTALDAEQREFTDIARNSASSLLRLIDELLEFARIAAGHIALECAPLDLVKLVQEVLAMFEVSAKERGVALLATIDGEPPGLVLGDGNRLRQVLINLVSNALKFTEQGSVHVQLQIRERAGRAELTCCVEDTGIGIAPAALPNIFDSFRQADSSIQQKFGGTGLGLAISKQLVEAMGGHIEVSSVEGQGSIFRFQLDLDVVDERALQRSRTDASKRGLASDDQLTILVAEDNEINQKVLRYMLGQMGHRSTFVDNGRAALEQVRAGDFDVVLMDIRMPVLDGPSAVAEIRSWSAPRADIPIIGLTADAVPERIASYLDCGMDACLLKPVDMDELQSMLYTVARPDLFRTIGRPSA